MCVGIGKCATAIGHRPEARARRGSRKNWNKNMFLHPQISAHSFLIDKSGLYSFSTVVDISRN